MTGKPLNIIKHSSLFAAGIAIGITSMAGAQDAASIAKKMQAAYQNVNSYSQRTSASGRVVIGGESQVSGMTAEVRYAKPNRAYIIVSAPSTGSVVGMNSGSGLTVYTTKLNKVIKLPAADSLGWRAPLLQARPTRAASLPASFSRRLAKALA